MYSIAKLKPKKDCIACELHRNAYPVMLDGGSQPCYPQCKIVEDGRRTIFSKYPLKEIPGEARCSSGFSKE